MVMVKKSTGKWRICVDFIDLSKACLNDSFPFPKINRLINSTIEFEFLSSLDANFGYYQIPMHPEDEEKTSFVTEEENFCYRAMPFDLKNTRATYQQMANKVFKH